MLRRIGLCKSSGSSIFSRITPIRCSFNKRGFKSIGFLRNALDSSPESSYIPPPPSPPVHTNLAGMTIFTLLAVGTIYTTSAVWENLRLKKDTPKVFEMFTRDKENVYDTRRKAQELRYAPGILYPPTTWPPVNQLFNPEGRQRFWEKLMPSEKFTYTVMAANIGIHTLSIFTPTLWSNIFVHIPGTNRNFTLLTCIFGHGSLIHLGLNMYGFHSFMPTLGQDPTFKWSIAHMTAFYLSAGVISSWAQASSARIRPNTPPVPFLGASGAVFAMIGAFALQHPSAQFQIMFIPYPFAAQELLSGVMLIDLLGVLGAFKTLRWAHAAHLSGALLGLGYVYFDGEKRIWSPLCRSVYKSFGMKKWENKV